METILMNAENSKTNESHKFVLHLFFTCRSSKLVSLLHVEKYKKTVQKQ